MPISIEQVAYSAKKRKKTKKKKNIKDIEEIMKNVNTTQVNTTKKTSTTKEKISMYLSTKSEKVTTKRYWLYLHRISTY